MAARRVSRGKGNVRRARGRRLAAVVALVIGVAFGGYAVSRSSLFGLSRIEVIGSRFVPATDVIAASGLRVGQPALGLDLGAARARVRALPALLDAQVVRAGSLAVRIVIVERRPAALVRAGSQRWLADQEGRRIDGMPVPRRLPVVVLPADPRVASETRFDTAAAIRTAVVLWRKLPKDLRARVGALEPRPDGNIELLMGRVRVLFGRPDRVEEKVFALGLVEERVASDNGRARTIDVSVPSRPAARIR